MTDTLTCVYCVAYPEGTPPRAALSGLIGASTKEELAAIELALRSIPGPDADKAAAINAIHALMETAD